MNLPLPHNPDEFIGTIPVSLSVICASPTNPRTEFNETEMAELTEKGRRASPSESFDKNMEDIAK